MREFDWPDSPMIQWLNLLHEPQEKSVYEKMRALELNPQFEIVEEIAGHVYQLPELGSPNHQCVVFIRRSGGAITYESEWAGLQTQTVIRMCIKRTRYLYDVLPCTETQQAIRALQNALWQYEARAFRRKIQKLNRQHPVHYEAIPVPFSPMNCETHPLGEDGHLCWLEAAQLYVATIGWSDYQPWPEFWFEADWPPVLRENLTDEQKQLVKYYELGFPKMELST
jgi:hypothetical protein